MASTFPSRARCLRRRWLFALALAALISGLPAAPAAAGPPADPDATYRMAPDEFTVDPALGAAIVDTLMLWSTGTATATVDLEVPAGRVVFRVVGQPCDGLPRLEVRIDGVEVFQREIAGSGGFAVRGAWSAGRHTITFTFANDHLGTACDRNLKIGFVNWRGAARASVGQELDLHAVTFSPPHAGGSNVGIVGAGYGTVPHDATLWITGSFAGVVSTQGADHFFLEISPTDCEGWPRFSLRIDGVLITEQDAVADSYVTYYDTAGDWADGLHTVQIAYLNDLHTTNCDRNLAVVRVRFEGRV